LTRWAKPKPRSITSVKVHSKGCRRRHRRYRLRSGGRSTRSRSSVRCSTWRGTVKAPRGIIPSPGNAWNYSKASRVFGRWKRTGHPQARRLCAHFIGVWPRAPMTTNTGYGAGARDFSGTLQRPAPAVGELRRHPVLATTAPAEEVEVLEQPDDLNPGDWHTRAAAGRFCA
jgi:hypothetical protein